MGVNPVCQDEESVDRGEYAVKPTKLKLKGLSLGWTLLTPYQGAHMVMRFHQMCKNTIIYPQSIKANSLSTWLPFYLTHLTFTCIGWHWNFRECFLGLA